MNSNPVLSTYSISKHCKGAQGCNKKLKVVFSAGPQGNFLLHERPTLINLLFRRLSFQFALSYYGLFILMQGFWFKYALLSKGKTYIFYSEEDHLHYISI